MKPFTIFSRNKDTPAIVAFADEHDLGVFKFDVSAVLSNGTDHKKKRRCSEPDLYKHPAQLFHFWIFYIPSTVSTAC